MLIAFFAMIVLDWFWAYYTLYVVERRASLAGLYAAGIALCGALTVILYIDNHWMIVPTALGSYVGTWFAVKSKRR